MFLRQVFIIIRDKRALNYGKKSEDTENLVKIEMTVAKESEINSKSEGVGVPLSDIEPGVFVSFKYSGFAQNSMPFNPQVSINCITYFINYYNKSYNNNYLIITIYSQLEMM